jgi:hypothetical protein
LSGFEVEAVEGPRQIEDAVRIEANHPAERGGRAGETLESDVDARPRVRALLFDDVGEDTVAGRQRQPLDDALEQRFEPDDRVDVVARRVEADDHVPAAVGKALEDREEDLVVVVAGTVGLDAGSEVLRRSDRDGV